MRSEDEIREEARKYRKKISQLDPEDDVVEEIAARLTHDHLLWAAGEPVDSDLYMMPDRTGEDSFPESPADDLEV